MGRTYLFNEEIGSWSDWGRVFQSVPAFEPLAAHILRREGLPDAPLGNLTPGTNAVFRAGDNVIKIFAPAESGFDQSADMRTELFAARRANRLGIASPRVIADGCVEDKYRFYYIISEYIDGRELSRALPEMSERDKLDAARRLRSLTDRLNTPCEPFNDIDILTDPERSRRWDRYPPGFRAEREEYIRSLDTSERVFVHGDLCGDNILIGSDGELRLIDFADSVLAPIWYEQALIAVELFDFDRTLLRGYFGEYDPERLAKLCLDGLLIHDFGGNIAAEHLGDPDGFHSLGALFGSIMKKIN